MAKFAKLNCLYFFQIIICFHQKRLQLTVDFIICIFLEEKSN